MEYSRTFVAGLPELDVHTLREDWALGTSLVNHWELLAQSLGLKPSEWIDTKGDRMYGAVVYLNTWFDLDDIIREDDEFTAETTFLGIRKPHALSRTEFKVGGKVKARVEILSSFIKRVQKGSNKKFSRVRDLWTAEDYGTDAIDALLDLHHENKQIPDMGDVASSQEINRITDFNTADFMYFKNYVRFAKAAEWVANRGNPVRLNQTRACFFYGNVDDGQVISTKVGFDGDDFQSSHHSDDGRRIFLSRGKSLPVQIAER